MIQKFCATVAAFSLMLVPLVTSAAYFGQVDTLVTNLSGFIDGVLIPFVFALALLMFVWGMFRFFVYGAHNEEDRSKGRQLIIWSIIGLSLMFSIWGIVAIFSEGIFGTVNSAPKLPGTPTL
jgi:hypothetical protein